VAKRANRKQIIKKSY